MPLYSYSCAHCGLEFDARQPVEKREAAPCPYCSYIARKVFTPTPYIQVPAHFQVMQSDFLPAAGDVEAWDARQGGSTAHAPRTQTLKEFTDSLPRGEV
jgi:putative FmdB family regulatory protein